MQDNLPAGQCVILEGEKSRRVLLRLYSDCTYRAQNSAEHARHAYPDCKDPKLAWCKLVTAKLALDNARQCLEALVPDLRESLASQEDADMDDSWSIAAQRVVDLQDLGLDAVAVGALRQAISKRQNYGQCALALLRKEHSPAVRSVLLDLVEDWVALQTK